MGNIRRLASCCVIDERGDTHPGRLSFTLVSLLSWMREVASLSGMAQPELLSACRSQEMQRKLQSLWDQGLRAGLAVRPVDNSRHIPDEYGICRAFDLANDEQWLAVMGPVVAAKWPNVEWGGSYLPPDPRHFEERS